MKRYYKKHRALMLGAFGMALVSNLFMVIPGALLKRDLIDSTVAMNLGAIGGIVLLMILVKALAVGIYIFAGKLQNLLTCRLTDDLRCDIFAGIFRRDIGLFRQTNTSDYISAIANDIKTIRSQLLNMLFMLLFGIVGIVASAVMMFYFQPIVGSAAILLAATTTLVPMWLGKRKAAYEVMRSKAMKGLTADMNDLFSGFEVVNSFGIFGHAMEKFRKSSEELRDKDRKASDMESVIDGLAQMISSAAQTAILGLGCWMVYQEKMTIGELTVFISMNSTFCSCLTTNLRIIPIVKGIQPVVKKVLAYADYQPEKLGGDKKPTLEKGISGENLSFGYREDALILQDVSFQMEAGKKYALLGPSGSGKTTLIRLLRGDYGNYQGSICYDGVELRELDHGALRRQGAIIQQEVYLFDDTIRNNICLFETFSQEEFDLAVEQSGVGEFMRNLPEGPEYSVGQLGRNLSGGQRQRIAIARALIRKTKLLILDEGTSALDKENATKIEEELLAMPDITLLTITHNLRTPEKYDGIWELKEGKLREKSMLTTV